MLKKKYAVILHLYTNPMKIMNLSLTNILTMICLIYTLGACTQSQTSKETQKEDVKADATEANTEAIPSTLENFDLTYYGRFKGQQTQLNLRRYGSALSGNWWMTEKEEVVVTGSLQENANQFSLDIIDLKGEKVGLIKGKLSEDKSLRGVFQAVKGDSLALEFLPTARNVKFFSQLKLDDLKLNKSSQNNKRQISIIYPQILGIEDAIIAKRVNSFIDKYFNENTWADSLEKGKKDFKEEVRYDLTLLNNDLVSICKHHHLNKNDDNTLFDDSHGITISFKRGKVYELRDLFKPNAIEALNKMLLARINKSCNNTLSKEVLEKCKMKGEETTSFSLNKGKVQFHLTERLPYESRGCGYLRLEYKDLRDFINPSGPLAEHLYDTKK